nr:18.8 kDa class II heat shock protein-like [Ipomoea batatas]
MDLRNFGLSNLGLESQLLSTIQDMLDFADDHDKPAGGSHQNNPSRAYVLDAKAMAATPADVKEYPNSYVFIVDMPGVKAAEIKVQVEDDNVLVDGVKYLRMERRVGKFMRKFVLPENANVEAINAAYRDGVLQVTVEKLPPPEPKKPKTVEVKVA